MIRIGYCFIFQGNSSSAKSSSENSSWLSATSSTLRFFGVGAGRGGGTGLDGSSGSVDVDSLDLASGDLGYGDRGTGGL
jgi:hypothetical protein